jgi:hypothetical protein
MRRIHAALARAASVAAIFLAVLSTTPAQTDREKERAEVITLGRTVFHFIDNPFFKEASVVDAQQTATARRDLKSIISLSTEIRKLSDRLAGN